MAGSFKAQIDVEGLRVLQAELRRIDAAWPKELRQANKEAAEIVAEGTRQSFASRPGVAPKVAASVRAMAQQRNASVKIGGNRWPFALGAEFGGGKHGPGNPTAAGGHTTQFPEFKRSGYSLYPTIAAKREEVIDAYGDALDRLTARAFPQRG